MNYHPGYDAPAILAEHRRWARQFAEPLAAEIRPHTNDRSPGRRLSVGFVSPDLHDHPVGRLLLPLFAHHERRQAELVGYSDVRVADGVTGQLKALADRWHETTGLSDPHLADRIRSDRIDILVDLALHTANNRMLVFARKPAPVQVTMIGMPATTGLATIDYRLTDPYLDPPGAGDGNYSEQSIRLPHCFWHHDPPEDDVAPAVAELPALRNGFVTFGCLNQFVKVSRPALELWLNILQSLPQSRLRIQSQPGRHLEAVRRLFQDGGIARDRVEFAAKVPRPQYFRRYHDLDVSLDPFPYNGHTSTLDSLWMGVPVITLAGRTAVGRGGVSVLSNLGLPELIAQTPQQYVELAVQWASDQPALAALRAGCGRGCRLPSCSTAHNSPPTWKPRSGGPGRPGAANDADHDRAGDPDRPWASSGRPTGRGGRNLSPGPGTGSRSCRRPAPARRPGPPDGPLSRGNRADRPGDRAQPRQRRLSQQSWRGVPELGATRSGTRVFPPRGGIEARPG